MSIRLDKIASLLKEELSLIFLNKVQDPALGLLTITNVKVSPDIRQAKVYISVYDKENRDDVLQKIEDIKGLIKGQLGQRLKRLRYIPDLVFFIDDTLDYVEKMDGLFKKIHENDNKESE
ncbi:MAG: 30S ribosome-binding factor RbfA [Ignavibacteria bacterium]|jgi:ribosome-binding factor A